MTASEQTPDLMLEALEKAGYRVSKMLNSYVAQSPDGWYCYPDTCMGFADLLLLKHEVIQKAYAHYQQAQELERLRAKVAELEGENALLRAMVELPKHLTLDWYCSVCEESTNEPSMHLYCEGDNND